MFLLSLSNNQKHLTDRKRETFLGVQMTIGGITLYFPRCFILKYFVLNLRVEQSCQHRNRSFSIHVINGCDDTRSCSMTSDASERLMKDLLESVIETRFSHNL